MIIISDEMKKTMNNNTIKLIFESGLEKD